MWTFVGLFDLKKEKVHILGCTCEHKTVCIQEQMRQFEEYLFKILQILKYKHGLDVFASCDFLGPWAV